MLGAAAISWFICGLSVTHLLAASQEQPCHLGIGQAAARRILSLPCWNSASLIVPWSRRSASLASPSAVPFPLAASWTEERNASSWACA